MKTTSKPFAILFGVATTIAFVSCGGNSNNKPNGVYQEPQQQETPSNNNSSSVSNDNQDEFVGTFRFNDGGGSTYTLSVNSDETVTLSGNGNTFYGSWDKRTSKYAGYTAVNFSQPYPYTTPNKAITTENTLLDGGKQLSYVAVKDGYLYFTASDAKSKNPNNRIAIR